MAVDEALLENASEDTAPTLRIYRWQRPTLSLGYFQPYANRQSHPASAGTEVVRRLSGGGAILHDQEITYSLIVPSTHAWAGNILGLYNTVHRALVKWLIAMAPSTEKTWQLALCGQVNENLSSKNQAFLCFQRRSPGDVLLLTGDAKTSHKIVGSAQRRRRGSVLQHGSIMWDTSQFAPEFFGFAQLTGADLQLVDAADDLSIRLPELLQQDFQESQLPGHTRKLAEKLLNQRHKSPAWVRRR